MDSRGPHRKLETTAAHLNSHIWPKGPIQGLCYAGDGDTLVPSFESGESCFRAEWRLRRLVLFLYHPCDLESGIWLLQTCLLICKQESDNPCLPGFVCVFVFVVFVFMKSI